MSDLTPTPVDDAACYARTVSLVRAARGGDQTARDSIFERYLPRVAEMVSLYLGRRLRTFVDEQDLVQESMLRALRAVQRFEEYSEGTFRAYMARIVRNCIIDASRRQRVRPVLREADSPAASGAMERAAATQGSPTMLARIAELEQRYEAARLQLNPRHREILGLREVLELEYSEICEVLGISSLSTARTLVRRARFEIRQQLGEHSEDVE
ncbi:MAG: sigma-70 family RNA polymerase sigma factor [Planctomycetes bacterium]|nr:sigma-70 family RNA polymerase sigma factor [Planctomycetota bacterium]MCB9869223.1 sigma-70 family RNA polymerase sigma factor [Planctomycetota bacterium]